MEIQFRILQEAYSLFRMRGIRSVTMDDIAHELVISKKTLYLHFPNKAAIVQAVVAAHIAKEKERMNEFRAIAADPIDELVMLLKSLAKTFTEVTPAMIFDVQKFYPRSWELFHDFKNNFIFEKVKSNLEQGVMAGLYRKDMDIHIVAKLRIEHIEMVFDPRIFPLGRWDIEKVQLEQFALFLHGLVTIKGKKMIYQYLNQTEDES